MSDPNIVVLGDLDDCNVQLPDPGLLQYYKNLDDRILWLDGDVDGGLLEYVKYILQWNREDKDVPVEDRKPIRIFFDSFGGSLDIADAVVSVIELSKTPIYGIAIGIVASAASLIYLACHKRYALKTSYFLLHRGSCSNMSGNYNEVQAAMQDYKEQVERMEQFYIAHLKYDADKIHQGMTTDWYIRNPECVESGLVNEIVSDISILI